MERNWRQGRTEGPPTVYGDCPWCDREIAVGEAAVCVWIQREREEPLDRAIPEVSVLDSDGVIALCGDCGCRLDSDTMRVLIQSFYTGRTDDPSGRGLALTERLGHWLLRRRRGEGRRLVIPLAGEGR